MSREIKFRVWSEDQKTYDYKFPYNSIGDFYVNTRGKVFSDFGNTVAPEVRQDAFIIEQYTGLKDKNGKEIYEGDIVKWLDGLNEYIEFKVEWQDNRARFCLRNEYSVFDYEDLNDKKEPYIEVIGNIHENPELLGGEE